MCVKREASNMRAPVLGHFGAAIAGLSKPVAFGCIAVELNTSYLASIRAYGVEGVFRHELHQRIDRYSRAARTNYNLNRWVSSRIEALGGAFAAGLGAYLVYGPGRNGALASNVGFTLAMAVQLSNSLLWLVRYLFSLHLSYPIG